MNKLKVLFGITLLIVSFMFIGYPRMIAYSEGGGTTYVTPTVVAPSTTTAVQQTTTTVSQTTQTSGYCGPRTTTVLSVYPTGCKSPSSCVENTYVQTDVTITLSGGNPQCYFPIGYTYYPDIRYKNVYYTGTVSGEGSHTLTYYSTHSAGTITSMAEAGSGVYYSTGTVTMIFSPKPNAAPVISAFTVTPSSGIEPLAVTFSGSATDAEGDPLTYTLIFDTTNTAVNVTGTINVVLSVLGTHTYNIGSHTARLIVKDATNTASIDTTVIVSSNHAPAITAFTATPAAGTDPITSVFRGSATDADGDSLTYTLIFDTANTAANATGTINSVLSVLNSHTYHVGNYTARLIVRDATHTVSADAFVYVFANHAPVIGTFTATPSSGYQPMIVEFDGSATDIDGDALTYTLIFDSTNTAVNVTGSISSVTSLLANHIYSGGVYTAELLVSDGINEVTATTGITVAFNVAPVIKAFTATPNSGKEPLTVNFDGAATDTDGDPLTYTLIFDTSDTTANATGTMLSTLSALGSHVYLTGTYIAELIVSDGIDEATATAGITVLPNTAPAITAFIAAPSSGREPLTVNFDGSATDADLDTLTYTLIFDTADASVNATGTITDVISALGTHVYAAGTYTPKLIVSDGIAETTATISVTSNANQIPVIIAFTATPSSGKDPLNVLFEGSATDADNDPLTYTLMFDNTDNMFNVTGTINDVLSALGSTIYPMGTYTAELIVSDGIAETNAAVSIDVAPNNAPVITSFTATPSSGRQPLMVTFNGSATDADGNPLTYIILFDIYNPIFNATGTITDIDSVLTNYIYYSAGAYDIYLVVSDGISETTAPLTINVVANNAPIIDVFAATPISGYNSLTAMFNGNATDADGEPLTYTLIYDVNVPSVNDTGVINSTDSILGSHTYTTGVYTAQLTVSDGITDTVSTTPITVLFNSPPVSSFIANATSGIIPFDVVVDGSWSYDTDGSIDHFSWRILEPDGNVYYSNGSGIPYGFTYTFTKSGIHIWSLNVWDDKGTNITSQKTIDAFDVNLVINSFNTTDNSGTVPFTTEFIVNFSGQLPVNYTLFCDITNTSWNYTGELNSTPGSVGNCTYAIPGDYTAQVDLSNQFANASTQFIVHVLTVPTAPASGGGGSSGIVLGVPNLTITILGAISYLGFHPSYALNGTRLYSFDPDTNTTIITLRIVNLANHNRTLAIKDIIPKDMATSLADVQVIPFPNTLYNLDPEIGWNVTLVPQQVFEIKYIFHKYIPYARFDAMAMPEIKEIYGGKETVVSPSTKTTTTGITGLVIGALGNPMIGGIVLIAIILALLAFTETGKRYVKTAKNKTSRVLSDFADELKEPEDGRAQKRPAKK